MSCGTKTQSFKICRCSCKWRCQCLIPRMKKPGAPFGTGSKRGTHIGLHPKFYTNDPVSSIAVGSYDPLIAKSKSTGISWKKELESEEFSRTMGGRVEKYATQRYLMKTGRGPGTHEIPQWPDIILNGACKAVKRNVGFGTVPLFQPAWPSTTPGPGE
ncbi:uncharacterized protein LOC143303441 [Bombus vancouverensis nearcticus]|uniref:uncharacterized protein LOC143303441 n=1 Tax=Bombus vancouverensis nearcticus TaxID=2705178 RepID=UPI00402B4E21